MLDEPNDPITTLLPSQRGLYVAGAWREPASGRHVELTSPGTGQSLGTVAEAGAADAEAAIAAAKAAFREWRDVTPNERAKILRSIAAIVRENARELATIDAADCGNPMTAMLGDADIASAQLDFFAGLVTEMKGASIPMGPGSVNFSLREPHGVVTKIMPFNHPFMFCAGKIAAPLAAGNTVVVKPPEQAPLSSLRFAELIDGLLPPGVFNLLPGGREVGEVLSGHRDVAMVSLIGSVRTGQAVMRSAAETIKPLLLELGGKNALIAYPDADPREVARALAAGMNFTWCGQSCGSTSRGFIHAAIYEDVLAHLAEACAAYRPGIPTDPSTTMGAIVSRMQYERVKEFIAASKAEGARLVAGGGHPSDPALEDGFFIEPTVFADVTPTMRIAREEVFGPVLAIAPWRDEAAMLEEVNAVEYGLTCSIWTDDLHQAHLTAREVEAGYVWINDVSKHFLGAPFGGVKQSGLGREECLEELLAYTREKNVHLRLNPSRTRLVRGAV
ncbi:putative aldehyde dehydrogenase [Aurantimonas manganoxydans SI85-9A1]|uniref:Putative aldehyde dehydrogenase n=1 Tax=Aurantimonas manganoxydans (strain ATCC BAA-1229 / DSM 21871 / SI85-9A1) TaxID=287752 RepID=Q1YKX2_AURMS|nr:aldehyde dehydrogenase family protein [Aurantimonas manganoxydans]EAS50401.1 putative aldehyde dehydrogenase [Aurantimonas manganoxydans SI85-9A1]